MDHEPVSGLQRRVAGFHSLRLDGLTDLVLRAKGASVLDIGCNRGLVGFEMYYNGARLVHGCDNYEEGITFCRHLFADFRDVRTQFEVVDLTEGTKGLLKAFGDSSSYGIGQYDIVLVLATVHKLKRKMSEDDLYELVYLLGQSTHKYLGWRGVEPGKGDNEAELALMEDAMKEAGLSRVHYSELSDLGPAAIWKRNT